MRTSTPSPPTPTAAAAAGAAAAAAAATNTHERNKAAKPPPRAPWWACRAALWGLGVLCCVTALAVNVLVTPGRDWLRHSGRDSIGWFRVGGGDEEALSGCDVGLLSSEWCSYFAIFMVVQTVASMNVSIAALLLLVAACRPRRFRWSICSGTFFMVYAVLQGVAVGLVVAIGRKLEDEMEAEGVNSGGSGRMELPPSFSFSSSASASASPTTPVEIEYGATLAFAFCCGVVGFNASLILFALPREPTPGAGSGGGALCDCCFRRKRRSVGARRVGIASRQNSRASSRVGSRVGSRAGSRVGSRDGSRAGSRAGSRRPSGLASPELSASGPVLGAAAASVFWTARPPPSAAPTYPRVGSAVGDDEAC